MDNIKIRKLAKWLDITDQQFGIIMSIYRLEARMQDATPKRIEQEYLRAYGTAPQKSNLFGQIRQLLSRDIIVKERQGIYSINLEVIHSLLQDRKEGFIRESDEFNKISEQLKEYFSKAALQTTKPRVRYLEHDELYEMLAKSLQNSDRFYTTADFPLIAYTYPLAAGIGTSNYLRDIWERCFDEGKLQACYLTTLDIDLLFNHAFRAYRDPKKTYMECVLIIEQLQNLLQTHSNIDIRYLKEPHGIDVFIPEKYEPREFFIFTRDEHRNITGGVEIRSVETAISAKQMFMRDFEYANRLQDMQGGEIIAQLKKELEKKYSICKI